MRYSTKFAIWLAVAAVVPLAGTGAWALHQIDKAVAELEGERFRLAGREIVSRLEAKAAEGARGRVATDEMTRVLEAEMKSASSYLGAGAALVGADGTVVAETGDPWGGAKDDLLAVVLAGGGAPKTHVVTRSCGMRCRRHAGVSPVVPSPYHVAFSLPPGPGSVAVKRLAVEFLLALAAALFCALAVGFHVAGPLEQSIRELLSGARKYGKGDFTHVIAKGPPDEIASVVEAFNRMAGDVGGMVAAANTRGLEGYEKFERLARDTERLHARLKVFEAFTGFAREFPAPAAFAKTIVEWFELELRAQGKKAVATGDASAWPEGSPLAHALFHVLDRACGLPGPFDLEMNARGFVLSTEGEAPGLADLAAGHPTLTTVRAEGGRTVVTVVWNG